VAAMFEVPFTFHVGMEQVSLPSASEADSCQQGLGMSEGSQAFPSPSLASPPGGGCLIAHEPWRKDSRPLFVSHVSGWSVSRAQSHERAWWKKKRCQEPLFEVQAVR
jgi:hypothetical protein